ncbi:hypothetical protein BJF82_09595 [Kytococcus sp. CUA-901]|nr:hypothetical protein BJF82_09595 [Kytococcus sp. CUA-901]
MTAGGVPHPDGRHRGVVPALLDKQVLHGEQVLERGAGVARLAAVLRQHHGEPLLRPGLRQRPEVRAVGPRAPVPAVHEHRDRLHASRVLAVDVDGEVTAGQLRGRRGGRGGQALEHGVLEGGDVGLACGLIGLR